MKVKAGVMGSADAALAEGVSEAVRERGVRLASRMSRVAGRRRMG
jgi:hypothetical protein